MPDFLRVFAATGLLLGAIVARPALADPWAMPGDLTLRSDIQRLADAGVISAPLMAWPVPWASIDHGIQAWRSGDGKALPPDVLAALARVERRLGIVRHTSGIQPTARFGVRTDEMWLRTFQDTPREEGSELELGASWMGERFAVGLRGQYASDPLDGDEWRLDGSYAAMVLGNHILSAGALDRWWGPGWQGSLIYSTNARPIPAFGLERNVALPFGTKWLSWIGPWSYKVVYGQLEHDRDVPNARFFGLHLSARPLPDLEIAVSRTAQWCGSGRPCDFGTFLDMLFGRDNRGDDVDLEDEPGNQLASVDLRWASPIGDAPYAIYGQATAEDEAGGLPSRWIALGGVEAWGRLETRWLSGNWRGHLEFTETTSEFYSTDRFDYTYEHFIYEDGYRYKGRAIGHAMDADSRSIGAGLTLAVDDGSEWSGLVRWATLNRKGNGRGDDARHSVAPEETEVLEMNLTYSVSLATPSLRLGRVTAGAGLRSVDNAITGESSTDLVGLLQWSWDFRTP